jgi:MFS family permease
VFTILRQRNFALIWAAQLISALGDWVLYIALPIHVYQLTNSALATGAMFAALTIPNLLFGSLAGVFVDRWNRKRTMILADLLRVCVLLGLVAVRSAEWVWLVYVIGFIETSISQFFGAARSALVPQLVKEDDLLAANSLSSIGENTIRLIGPILGGAMFALLGMDSVIALDIASYLLSALLLSWIVVAPPAGQPQTTTPPPSIPGARGLWRDWLESLRLVTRKRIIGVILLVQAVALIAPGILNVLLMIFVKQELHGGALEFGWIMSAQGIGGIVGGLVIGYFNERISPTRLIALSLWFMGICLLITFNIPSLPLALVLVAAMGMGMLGWLPPIYTLLQIHVDDQYRGRVFGISGNIQSLMLLLGMGIASLFGDAIGPVPLLNLASALFLLAGLIALVGFQRVTGQRSIDGTVEPESINKEIPSEAV